MFGPNPKIIVLNGGQPEAFADAKVGNAVHSAGGRSITIYGGLPDFTGVLAQEWNEIDRERKQGLALGFVLAIAAIGILLLVHAPAVLVAMGAVAAAVLGWVLGSNYAPEAHEVASHALTALVNAQFDSIPIATAEGWGADSLSRYGWAHGETPAALIDKMRATYPRQQQWIDGNRALLAGWQRIRLPVRGPQ